MSGLLQAFVDGSLNPLVTPAHALTLLALALVLGQQDRRGVSFFSFAIGLAGGLVAIALAVGEVPARTVLLADAAALGVMVAAAWAPKPLAWLLAAIAGTALALDSPPQAVTIAEGHVTLVGTGVGACAMLLVAVAVVGQAKSDWQRLGVRILGSWIAASAILVLAVWLR
jgi:urease accessory protein